MGYNGTGYDQTALIKKDKKRCPSCKKIKPLADFWGSIKAKNGVQSNCKKCAYEKTKQCRRKKSPFQRWAGNMVSKGNTRRNKRGVPFNLNVEYLQSIYPKDNKCPVLRY